MPKRKPKAKAAKPAKKASPALKRKSSRRRTNPRRCNMCRATGKVKRGNPCPMCRGNGYVGIQRNPGESVAAFKRRMHTTVDIKEHEELVAAEEDEEEEAPPATPEVNPRRRRRRNAEDDAAQRAQYRALHWGDEPSGPIEVDVPDPSEASAVLGKLVKVEYFASKGGRKFIWVHKHLTPPLLVVTKRGKLLIAEPKGKKCYLVTRAGIEG
jgi:hypothetical protein